MSAKTFLVVCVSALFAQSAVSQCGCGGYSASSLGLASNRLIGGYSSGLGYSGLNSGIISSGVASASGGGFPVSSTSRYAPKGISLLSQNSIYGDVNVRGQMPFLAAVAVNGEVPSSGSAGVSYSCGDSNVGISSQSLSAAGIGASNAGGLGGLVGLNARSAGSRLAGSSCGCRSIY